MKKSLILAAALLSIVFFTSNAFSWGHGNYNKRGGCGNGYNNPDLSSLTNEQKGQLSDLRQKFIDETYETRSAIREKHRDIRMLLETSDPDKAKLTALSDKILKLKKKMSDIRIDTILAAKEIAPSLDGSFFGPHRGQNGKGRGYNNGPKPCGQGQAARCFQ